MINRDFSVNLLLHRLISQTHINNVSNDLENPVGNDDKPAKDKNKKNKKVGPTNPIDNGISQITNFNYVLNGILKSNEPLIINIPYFKTLLKKNKITKWNGTATEFPCLKELLFYLNSPSFLHISYTPMSVKVKVEDLEGNPLSGVFISLSSSTFIVFTILFLTFSHSS